MLVSYMMMSPVGMHLVMPPASVEGRGISVIKPRIRPTAREGSEEVNYYFEFKKKVSPTAVRVPQLRVANTHMRPKFLFSFFCGIFLLLKNSFCLRTGVQ